MLRTTFLALSLLLSSRDVFGQTDSTDSQTLQALLAEVRQLRHDLRTTTLAAQRAQILIYRVQAQESVVRRLQERVDDSHSKISKIQTEQKRLAAGLKQLEDSLEHAESQAARKEDEQGLRQVKARLDLEASNEQEAETKLTEAEAQLRLEQAKLDRLQDELERLDKALENPAVQPASTPQ